MNDSANVFSIFFFFFNEGGRGNNNVLMQLLLRMKLNAAVDTDIMFFPSLLNFSNVCRVASSLGSHTISTQFYWIITDEKDVPF